MRLRARCRAGSAIGNHRPAQSGWAAARHRKNLCRWLAARIPDIPAVGRAPRRAASRTMSCLAFILCESSITLTDNHCEHFVSTSKSFVMFNSTTGNLIDRVTQRWVQFTGISIDVETHPWLEGPIGSPDGIGKEYFNELAQGQGWELRRNRANSGLLPAFNALRGPSFNPERVNGRVIEF